jgi:hypothetical protein
MLSKIGKTLMTEAAILEKIETLHQALARSRIELKISKTCAISKRLSQKTPASH